MSRDEAVEALAPGTKVKLWVGMTLLGYPERGTIRQYLPDFPFGPTYEVEFPPNDFVPSALPETGVAVPRPRRRSQGPCYPTGEPMSRTYITRTCEAGHHARCPGRWLAGWANRRQCYCGCHPWMILR